jgi:hypothetical protein
MLLKSRKKFWRVEPLGKLVRKVFKFERKSLFFHFAVIFVGTLIVVVSNPFIIVDGSFGRGFAGL